jgi:hypothetical protein
VYYFITDETNVTKTETTEFFIYGGLVLSDEQLSVITADITSIRQRYGFNPNDSLKFDTNSRPPQVTQQNHANAKNDVIEACCRAGAKFIVYTDPS